MTQFELEDIIKKAVFFILSASILLQTCENGGIVVKFLSFKGSIPVTHLSSKSLVKGAQVGPVSTRIYP